MELGGDTIYYWKLMTFRKDYFRYLGFNIKECLCGFLRETHYSEWQSDIIH